MCRLCRLVVELCFLLAVSCFYFTILLWLSISFQFALIYSFALDKKIKSRRPSHRRRLYRSTTKTVASNLHHPVFFIGFDFIVANIASLLKSFFPRSKLLYLHLFSKFTKGMHHRCFNLDKYAVHEVVDELEKDKDAFLKRIFNN